MSALKRLLWPGMYAFGFGLAFAYGAHRDALTWRVSSWRINNARQFFWWRFVLTVPAKRLHS
jgi:hypothetical protein